MSENIPQEKFSSQPQGLEIIPANRIATPASTQRAIDNFYGYKRNVSHYLSNPDTYSPKPGEEHLEHSQIVARRERSAKSALNGDRILRLLYRFDKFIDSKRKV